MALVRYLNFYFSPMFSLVKVGPLDDSLIVLSLNVTFLALCHGTVMVEDFTLVLVRKILGVAPQLIQQAELIIMLTGNTYSPALLMHEKCWSASVSQ